MSLLYSRDQVSPEVAELECHACHTRHRLDDLDESFRCPDCGIGGMIPRRASMMERRFPPGLARRYTPVPEALMDHAHALGIGAHEILAVIALERHRREFGDEVFPSRATIAGLTGLSIDQVMRAIKTLVDEGHVSRRQPGMAGSRGRATNRYNLDPLWYRLAELDAAAA